MQDAIGSLNSKLLIYFIICILIVFILSILLLVIILSIDVLNIQYICYNINIL